MGQLKAIITDFDGTLFDTFIANYLAYKEAFKICGYELSKEKYKECYGLRFDEFCNELNINIKDRQKLKDLKKKIYPKYFSYINLNYYVYNFLKDSKKNGLKLCIASTASKENLYNILDHFRMNDFFDVIITGEDVLKGKPDPEVYLKALALLNCYHNEVLVFEDSDTGCKAVENANLNYIRV